MKTLGHVVLFATGALCTLGAQQVYKNEEVKASINSARDFIRSLKSKESEVEKSAEIEVESVEVKESG